MVYTAASASSRSCQSCSWRGSPGVAVIDFCPCHYRVGDDFELIISTECVSMILWHNGVVKSIICEQRRRIHQCILLTLDCEICDAESPAYCSHISVICTHETKGRLLYHCQHSRCCHGKCLRPLLTRQRQECNTLVWPCSV